MSIEIIPVHIPQDIHNRDRLGRVLIESGTKPTDGDVVVVASKIVAKAEGRVEQLGIEPDAWRGLITRESRRILRERNDLFITETHHGFVCANAGIDRSNTDQGSVVLLPKDPDNSAHVLRNELRAMAGATVATIVSDTTGRAWRDGCVETALGCAGITPVFDQRGETDAFGNQLSSTRLCIADQLAASAGAWMGKAARTPFVIIRGVDPKHFGEGSIARDVVRNYRSDMFR